MSNRRIINHRRTLDSIASCLPYRTQIQGIPPTNTKHVIFFLRNKQVYKLNNLTRESVRASVIMRGLGCRWKHGVIYCSVLSGDFFKRVTGRSQGWKSASPGRNTRMERTGVCSTFTPVQRSFPVKNDAIFDVPFSKLKSDSDHLNFGKFYELKLFVSLTKCSKACEFINDVYFINMSWKLSQITKLGIRGNL